MTREWKPGDVAMMIDPSVMAMRVEKDCGVSGHGYAHAEHWHYLRPSNEGCTWGSDPDRPARPLVVIDPEDREQVERLVRLFDHEVDGRPFEVAVLPSDLDDMQAALREFANPTPPKPDEPQGLGAVVEDDRGRRFTRYHATGRTLEPQPWALQVDDDAVEIRYGYADIAAVRVLSEGVQP